jgi:hypothetical protein
MVRGNLAVDTVQAPRYEFMYMYACIYMYMYMYARTHARTHTRTHTHTQTVGRETYQGEFFEDQRCGVGTLSDAKGCVFDVKYRAGGKHARARTHTHTHIHTHTHTHRGNLASKHKALKRELITPTLQCT